MFVPNVAFSWAKSLGNLYVTERIVRFPHARRNGFGIDLLYHETTTFVQEYQFFDYKEDLSAEMINTFPIFAIRKVTL